MEETTSWDNPVIAECSPPESPCAAGSGADREAVLSKYKLCFLIVARNSSTTN